MKIQFIQARPLSKSTQACRNNQKTNRTVEVLMTVPPSIPKSQPDSGLVFLEHPPAHKQFVCLHKKLSSWKAISNRDSISLGSSFEWLLDALLPIQRYNKHSKRARSLALPESMAAWKLLQVIKMFSVDKRTGNNAACPNTTICSNILNLPVNSSELVVLIPGMSSNTMCSAYMLVF